MAEADSLDALQGLHQDLLAFCDNRLNDIDRLVEELKSRIEEFRALLDHKKKNDQSRQQLAQKTLDIDGEQYAINEDFKQEVLQIAETLDLDEIDAAKLYLQAQEDALELDRSPIVSAVIRFHKKRQFLLECLRLVFGIPIPELENMDVADAFRTFKTDVLNTTAGSASNGSNYWIRCLAGLADIEAWLHRLADLSQRATVMNHTFSSDAMEIIELENKGLLEQHESLAAITSQLTKDGFTDQEDFRKLLAKVRTLERHDLIMVHYIPVVMSCISRFGPDNCTPDEAQEINQMILADNENETWGLRSFHAAAYMWWTAEYLSRNKPEDEEKKELDETSRVEKALQDGAFHFMLSIAQDIKRSDWYDPAKAGLVNFLLHDTTVFAEDVPRPAEHFQSLLMDQYQSFVDAFISHMPNTLRNLKFEEDNQRRELLGRFNRNPLEYQYHLERFLVVLAYAFENDPEAAMAFWDDPEGNLYGFLQWAAKRQTTPRVAAFSEMLRSISEDQQCANAAHQFLLEEGSPVAGKLRRTGSLSWTQIFAEMEFYASTLRELRPAAIQPSGYLLNQPVVDQTYEPESAIMLECYLRLVSHLCRQSDKARDWVLSRDPTVSTLTATLFQLANGNIETRLRACIFTTLASLLTDKTPLVGNDMWTDLDVWVNQPPPSTSVAARSGLQSPPSAWDTVATANDFEQSNTLVGLLCRLVAPYTTTAGLNDALPFPENLGAAYRMPGIDLYVDFALNKVFGELSTQITDPIQLRILRLNSLDFIATCLSTFNEDLVVVANRSSFPVESAMRSSSLKVYVTLHPFARVMEWLHNEKVLKALFATAHQDIDEVNKAFADSPYILSLVRSIEVMNLMMKLQATYLDIIRPLVKEQQPARKGPIPHSAIATFEDALLNHLDVIVDLGLYCGTGHQELTIASLILLERLSASRKLVVSPAAGFGKYSDRSKLISVFEKNGEGERVSRSMISALEIDDREIEARQLAPGYVIKENVLSFLQKCLVALPDRPTLAHLLLGFGCRINDLEITSDSLFAESRSLFHAVLKLAVEYPDRALVPSIPQPTGEDAKDYVEHPYVGQPSYFAWLSNIKEACTEILRQLWKSPISCVLVMTDLRYSDFVFIQATQQALVGPHTLWDGMIISDPDFLVNDSALALRNFLRQRAAYLDYFSRELRVSIRERMAALRARLQSTILGSTSFPGEPATPNLSIFDLFDFMELEIPSDPVLPPFFYLQNVDFDICRRDGIGSSSPYELTSAQELIQLRKNELLQAGQSLEGGLHIQQFEEEASLAIISLLGINQQKELTRAHAETLRQWTQFVTVAVESCDFDQASKTAFVLQAYQLILPKLERALGEDEDSALVLLSLVQPLMRYIEFSSALSTTKSIDFGNDNVFQVFRVCLNGIVSLVTTAPLRELCYQICFHFLRNSFKVAKKGSPRGRYTLRSISLAGDRLMEVLCDDAYSGQGSCRVSALLLLDALVMLVNREESKYMNETFGRLNFVGVLVDSIKQMPMDLRSAPQSDIPSILSFYNAALALLLRVSQTRPGATQVMNAGLFQSVRDSQLFSSDPDIGLEMEDPSALGKFFDLMLSVLRIINAVLLSKGRNDQTVKFARDFLEENRSSVVSVFKRHANVGGLGLSVQNGNGKDRGIDLSDLVDHFTLLISASGFLEFEDTATRDRAPLREFS